MKITITNLTRSSISTSFGLLSPSGSIVDVDPTPDQMWKIQHEMESLINAGRISILVDKDADSIDELEDVSLKVIESLIPAYTSSVIVFAEQGTMPSGTRYMYPGTANASANEIFIRMPRACTVRQFSVRARVAPGVGHTDVYTLRKNGVDTIITASLVDTATQAYDGIIGINFAAADDMSLKAVTSAGSSTSDVIVTLEML